MAFKKTKKMGSPRSSFFAETVYDLVRWWRKAWALVGSDPQLDQEGLWRLFAFWWVYQGHKLPDWTQFNGLTIEKIEKRISSIDGKIGEHRVLRESLPDWLDELGVSELGEKEWEKAIASLNSKAPVVLRTNTLLTDKEKLRQLLAEEGIETKDVELSEFALELVERKNVFRTDCFAKGYFEVQDSASQRVGLLLSPRPGERVIDACAGAGGKSLHLAALMQNKGKVLSMDIHERKLEELKKRARRGKISIIETRPIAGSKTIKRLAESADALLLDVPCTGLGVIRRNPDSKWKLDANFLNEIRETQSDILNRYSKMTKVGGRLVYSTCSILPSENQNQVNQFLSEHKGWKLVSQEFHRPDIDGGDGFYAALLSRIE